MLFAGHRRRPGVLVWALMLGVCSAWVRPAPRTQAAARLAPLQSEPTSIDTSRLQQIAGTTLLGAAMALMPMTSFPDAASAQPLAGKQNAPTATGSKVNKDPESLLRYGLPIENSDVRKLQLQVETAKNDIKVKRINAALGDTSTAKSVIKNKRPAMLKSVRASEVGAAMKLLDDIDGLLDTSSVALNEKVAQGSVQEREELDRAYTAQSNAALKVTELEEMMVPDGFRVAIPDEYKALPALQVDICAVPPPLPP